MPHTTKSGIQAWAPNWTTGYNFCLAQRSGSSLMRIENTKFPYDQSTANYIITGFYFLFLNISNDCDKKKLQKGTALILIGIQYRG